jgi:hypothetical protein
MAAAIATRTMRTLDDGSLANDWDPTAVTDWDGVIFYPPMPDVRRVPYGSGGSTAPEPLMDLGWSDLELLRWRAGLLAFDTGIVVCVGDDSPNYGLVVNHPDGGFTMFAPGSRGFIEGVMDGIALAAKYMPERQP